MLTKRQKEVLDFVKSYSKKNGYSPSLQEIQKKFKLASVSTAHFHISKLQSAGYITRQDGKARSIDASSVGTMIKIPLLGYIAAGQPIEAIEIPGETISIVKDWQGTQNNHYALKVQGDSMIDDGIFDGDIVVIRKQEVAENGQTVVAIIDDNETTLKKLYRENGKFKLQPANQSLLPLYRNEVEVRGIVVKVIRNFGSQIKSPYYQTNFLDLKNPFFNSHLITYIGNKRRLLPFLYQGFSKIRDRIGKDKLVILDGFAGSGASARLLKAFASELHVNDLEDYSNTVNRAYLTNRTNVDLEKLSEYINWLNTNKLKTKSRKPGFIEKNYAPKNDNSVRPGED